MKLTIKTLDQKTFHVNFDESKTVWELKGHLNDMPEVGVGPEQQQLIYAGRVLDNEHILKSYNIDERKFLVVMTKKFLAKKPSKEKKETSSIKKSNSAASSSSKKESPPNQQANDKEKHAAPTNTAAPTKAETSPAAASTVASTESSESAGNTLTATAESNEALIQNIVSMGYAESDVRRALLASYNNPDRAIEYLIEGIPEFPEMLQPPPNSAENPLDPTNPLYFLRQDPRFNQLRQIIQQRPELLSTILARIGQTNPALLSVIRDHQEDFIQMLNDTDENLNAGENSSTEHDHVVLTNEEQMAVERLVALGFPREIVVQAYFACEKNEEETADFLCRHMEDN